MLVAMARFPSEKGRSPEACGLGYGLLRKVPGQWEDSVSNKKWKALDEEWHSQSFRAYRHFTILWMSLTELNFFLSMHMSAQCAHAKKTLSKAIFGTSVLWSMALFLIAILHKFCFVFLLFSLHTNSSNILVNYGSLVLLQNRLTDLMSSV